ncbi:MAG: heparan-alpha-glucosaminide N-acetyltransferase domain-containing protein [Bacteroidota bacterium]
MTPTLNQNKKRIESIDILRGIVMIIMALDHVRDYFHIGSNLDDPLNLATTTPLLFFTRWITHFCAPIFVFLSGTSVYLQSLRKTKKELGTFLLKRGLWLILAEWTIVAFGWTFNPFFNTTPFQVIWTIGISMFILGLLILMRLPYIVILITGAGIVFSHNLLDIPESAPGFKPSFFWDLVHHGAFTLYQYSPGHYAMIVYAFGPWAGLMMLGYCAGILFTPQYSSEQRSKMLTRLGFLIIIFFIALRFTNLYGDPVQWSTQRNWFYTFLSFIKINKYPPSLLYMSLTIGIALLFLGLIEKIKNKFTDTMVIYGRTAFFYYIIHIYIIHIIAAILFFTRGHSFADAANVGKKFPFLFIAPGEGYSLLVVYIVWIAVVIALYPLCKWYDRYKTNHKEKWWLSYL